MNNLLIAPLQALTDPGLTDSERRVLLALYSFRNKNADTVWPSLEGIAHRANIGDVPRISKITKSLEKKGWLSKKKRGFTGCNEYKLTVPEDENTQEIEDTNLANSTKLVGDTKKDDSANLEENTNTNLANNTKSNLAKFTKYKEQQSEQQSEQRSEKPKIPFKQIQDLYNEILGEHLGSIRGMTDQRKKHIQARIREEPDKRINPDWWAKYFEVISETPFLIGGGPPRPDTGKTWKPNFDWLINQNNMIKIIEGNYE